MQRLQSLAAATAAVALLAMGGAAVLANSIPGTPSTPVSDEGVTPYIIAGENPGGNRTCAEVATAFGLTGGFLCETGRINYESGSFDGGFSDTDPAACANTTFTVTTDGTYVSWEAKPTPKQLGAIVKGSNEANVYYYDNEVFDPKIGNDSGLASPPNASGKPAGLSNLTFCWNPGDDEQQRCWADETAWAAGSRYVSRGNWATYTPYGGSAKTVTLFAGQTLNAGSVSFSAASGGSVTITVTLNAGFRFDPEDMVNGQPVPVTEQLKVQDYATAPSGNPAPGLFNYKADCPNDGAACTITVPANNFYGVHVDVEREVPCAE